MAFTFTVEDGTGVAGANSYVTTAQADDIIGGDPFLTAWANLDDAVKGQYLAKATSVIDTYMNYSGRPALQTQALAWPRKCASDVYGCSIAVTVIPQALKNAVALYAGNLAQTGNPEAAIDETRGIKSIKADVVEIVFDASDRKLQIPDTITYLLRSLGAQSRGTLKVVRT